MNRLAKFGARVPSGVPRVSGDEPPSTALATEVARCSPRERGMNRIPTASTPPRRSVPRVSGDEPMLTGHGRILVPCSPRERG